MMGSTVILCGVVHLQGMGGRSQSERGVIPIQKKSPPFTTIFEGGVSFASHASPTHFSETLWHAYDSVLVGLHGAPPPPPQSTASVSSPVDPSSSSSECPSPPLFPPQPAPSLPKHRVIAPFAAPSPWQRAGTPQRLHLAFAQATLAWQDCHDVPPGGEASARS